MIVDEHRARRYLLGELDEADEAAVEAAALADAEAFTALELAEDDLFEACARAELSPREAERFAARFLADADGRRRLEVTRGLIERAARLAPAAAPARPPWWRRPVVGFAFAAAVVLLVLVGGGLLRDRGPHPGGAQLATLRVELTQATRGEAEPVVALPAGRRVVLHLHPDVSAARLRLTLLGPDGAPAAPSALAAELVVDATHLPEGRYELHAERLAADGTVGEDLAYYAFRVTRQR